MAKEKQFISLFQFFKLFPNEEVATKFYEEARWPNGVRCPKCDSKETVQIVKSGKPQPYHCKKCRKYFSVRVGTVMEASPIPLQKWLMATYLLTTARKSISSYQLARELQLSQKTAWFLLSRITVGISCKIKKEKEKPAPKSLLQYPGDKTRGAKEILKYFPSRLDNVCSPFIGGGSIELELANKGIKVYGYDIFEPLTSFWQEVLRGPEELAERVKKYYPLTKSKFYSLQSEYMGIRSKKEKAAVFFVLNRASFSGTTLSGGMSPGHPRFTQSIIERLSKFKIDNLKVENADYHDSLPKHKKDFLYLDPPYANNGKLYGERGDVHENFDHEGLAEIITEREGWILSYNDCHLVRDLYKDFRKINLKWAYGMNSDKKSNKLLILSNDFIEI